MLAPGLYRPGFFCRHPGVEFNGIAANGQWYRVEVAVLAEESS